MLDRWRFVGAAPEPTSPNTKGAPHAVDAKVSYVELNTIAYLVLAFFGGDTNSLMPRNFLHTSLLERYLFPSEEWK